MLAKYCTTLAKKIVTAEIDPHCNHVISCEIDFNLQCELATRRAAGRVDVESKLDIARFHMIRLSDQPHEFLSCKFNDFFGQGSTSSTSSILFEHRGEGTNLEFGKLSVVPISQRHRTGGLWRTRKTFAASSRNENAFL